MLPEIDFQTAVVSLQQGNVVAIPTETVYGLGAGIVHENAVKQVFSLKGRPATHPLIIHVADKADIANYAVAIPDYVERLLSHFSPGPLTVVLKRSNRVSPLVTGGQDTVAIRIPQHELTRELIRQVGAPIAAPSANRFGHISPTHPSHVYAEFGDSVKILSGGACQIGIESTIIDATHPSQCCILRQGMITASSLKAVLGTSVTLVNQKEPTVRVSGMLKKHYAPSKPTFLFSSESQLKALQQRFPSLYVLSFSASTPMPLDATVYAKVLYQRLRDADASHATAIAIEQVPHTEAWLGVQDRLLRASSDEPCYDGIN